MRFTLLLFALVTTVLASQAATAQEIQVPFDTSGRVEVFTRELEAKLGLFADVPGFEEARLFRTGDTLAVLEITALSGKQRTRSRREMSIAQMEELRARVTTLLESKSPTSVIDQEGRSRLLVGTSALGLTYYGWAIPMAFGAEDEKAYTVLYMGTAAASFFVPFFLTQNSQVTKAQANLTLYGLSMGLAHGMLLYTAIGGGDPDEQGLLGTGALVGLTEGVIGFMIAKNGMSEATSNMIATGGIMGAGFGALSSVVLGAEDAEVFGALTLLGSFGGSIVGNAMTKWDHYSLGDASVVSTASLLGTATPPALMFIAGVEDGPEIYAAATMAGMVGGAILGHNMITGREFSEAQGNYISLGTTASAAFGLGLGYLISENSGETMVATTLAGGWLGYALLYGAFEDDAAVSREMGGVHLDVSPVGLGSLVSGRRPETGTVPVAGLRWEF